MKNLKTLSILILIAAFFITSCSDDYTPLNEDIQYEKLEKNEKDVSNLNEIAATVEIDDEFYFISYEDWKENGDLVSQQIPNGSTIESLQQNEFLLDNMDGGAVAINSYLQEMKTLWLSISSLSDEELIENGFLSENTVEYMNETTNKLLEFTVDQEVKIYNYLNTRFNTESLLADFDNVETKTLLIFGYNLRNAVEDFFDQEELAGSESTEMRECGFFEAIGCAAWIYKSIATFLIIREYLNTQDDGDIFQPIANICIVVFNAFTVEDCRRAMDNGLVTALWNWCCGNN